ncbi:hypothetical protein HUG15_05640 [Salicibibacter cibarius]|uniref:Uncharacterized protein n=1 Tax=Salicibibacter cibarius TaxID=2743000 RepID=A0A7T6Z150_9BACI|nr:hypothetical protein [Salicibibacter cibarius]QQK75075.1 hypothetical protein HUG15_05305 [Salicibibacter cibarius]QQK75136.1 hypothetical protein HUG15_05640 [Salicibibacter cibarius]
MSERLDNKVIIRDANGNIIAKNENMITSDDLSRDTHPVHMTENQYRWYREQAEKAERYERFHKDVLNAFYPILEPPATQETNEKSLKEIGRLLQELEDDSE